MREEEKKRPSQPKNIKKLFKKRWVYPAVYLACAALLITGIFWYQSLENNSAKEKFSSNGNSATSQKDANQKAIEVNKAVEDFKLPVKNPELAKVEKKFYDPNASVKEQEAALVVYENTYQPNQGIDITMKNGKTFDVVAAIGGTVTTVKEDAVLGNVIEVEHSKGVVTQYQSVKDIAVKEGDVVKQGQTLAKAGQSELNKEAGTHLHFEIRKNEVAVNPESYFNKSVSDVKVPSASSSEEDQSSGKNQTTESTSSGDGSN